MTLIEFDPAALARMQQAATTTWHTSAALASPPEPLAALVLAQHRVNFDLWHQEDDARDPHAPDASIAGIKHAIDRLNQQRNDLVQQIDESLLEAAGEQAPAAPLHSETPGMMIDRLSILALKIFHTEEQSRRTDAGDAHLRRNLDRLAILEEQRADLIGCLTLLWEQVRRGERRFKLYRQMKMYNDAELNPVLYRTGIPRR